MRLKPRTRRRLWDLVMVLALGGFVYGAFELIELRGWGMGIVIAVVMGVLGVLAMEVLYPLWFSDRG